MMKNEHEHYGPGVWVCSCGKQHRAPGTKTLSIWCGSCKKSTQIRPRTGEDAQNSIQQCETFDETGKTESRLATVDDMSDGFFVVSNDDPVKETIRLVEETTFIASGRDVFDPAEVERIVQEYPEPAAGDEFIVGVDVAECAKDFSAFSKHLRVEGKPGEIVPFAMTEVQHELESMAKDPIMIARDFFRKVKAAKK